MKQQFFQKTLAAVLAVLFACIGFGCGTSAQEYTREFAYEKAELESPLRGIALWNTSSVKPLPYALEYLPIPLNQIVTESGTYDFTYADTRLDAIATRGNHTILRFMLWEPPASYLPQAFLADGVKTVMADGIQIADFSDDALIDKLCELIAQLGIHYDGDPRIGFLQLGLMGRWGEWNYGNGYPSEAVPSAAQYNRIYAAFDEAFDKTKLQARNPNIGNAKQYAVGYHDDNFMYSTLGSGGGDFKYLCEQGGIAADLWKTESFGAELSGNENGDFFSTDEKKTRFVNSVKYQNFSVMLWQKYDIILADSLWMTHQATALELTRCLGYELYVKRARVARQASGKTEVLVDIQNTGNAPFYYDWNGKAEFYSGERLVGEQTACWALSKLMPNETKTFTLTLDMTDAEQNSYDTVLVSIVNPLSEISSNAKPFRFANKADDQKDAKLMIRI